MDNNTARFPFIFLSSRTQIICPARRSTFRYCFLMSELKILWRDGNLIRVVIKTNSPWGKHFVLKHFPFSVCLSTCHIWFIFAASSRVLRCLFVRSVFLDWKCMHRRFGINRVFPLSSKDKFGIVDS